MIQKIDKVFYRVSAAIGSLSYIGIVAMTLLNIVDVVLNKVFGMPIQGAYELTERLLMCTVFASLAYGQACKSHINTTLVITHFPRVLKFLMFGVMQALATLAAILWTYGAWIQIFESIRTNTVTAVLKIPLYPFYAFEFVTMIAFSLMLLWDTIIIFLVIKNDWCADHVTGSWA